MSSITQTLAFPALRLRSAKLGPPRPSLRLPVSERSQERIRTAKCRHQPASFSNSYARWFHHYLMRLTVKSAAAMEISTLHHTVRIAALLACFLGLGASAHADQVHRFYV